MGEKKERERRERRGKKKDTYVPHGGFFKRQQQHAKEKNAGSFVETGRRPLDLGFTCCGNDGISLCTQLKSKSVLKCTSETNKKNIPFSRISHAKCPKEAWQNGIELSSAMRKHIRYKGTFYREAINPR